MDKEYICGAPVFKHSKLTGDAWYLTGTIFTLGEDGQLYDPKGIRFCIPHSQFARDNIIVGNDDRKGKERYELCKEIVEFFNRKNGDDFEERIKPAIIQMYDNKIAVKYNQNGEDQGYPWIWGDNFYCAPVKDLRYIKRFLYDSANNK